MCFLSIITYFFAGCVAVSYIYFVRSIKWEFDGDGTKEPIAMSSLVQCDVFRGIKGHLKEKKSQFFLFILGKILGNAGSGLSGVYATKFYSENYEFLEGKHVLEFNVQEAGSYPTYLITRSSSYQY